MFINPNRAIQEGWIRGIKNPEKQIQPNAIDFTLDTVKPLNYAFMPYICENKSQIKMRGVCDTVQEVKYLHSSNESTSPKGQYWEILAGRVYDGTSDMYVNLPEGVAALLFTRSTFTRNGVFITSGLYDSGYNGHIGFTIYTIGGSIQIEPGVRIGQIAFVASEHAGLYTGGWNHNEGTHYATIQ